MQARYLIREVIERTLFTGFVDETQLLQPTNGAPGVGQFRTYGIQNRAAIPDITKNLKVHFGVERIPVTHIVKLVNEIGPNQEPVWGVEGDDKNLIRFVGDLQQVSYTEGNPVESHLVDTANEFIEIVFYGTGLNVLYNVDSNSRDLRVTVDGGAESGNIIINGSGILSTRGYRTNQIVSAASGLPLGLHTIKLRDNSTTARMKFYGFEILNQSTSLIVNPGTAYKGQAKLKLASQQTVAYNSGFESGSLNSRGGRVVVYLKEDGTIGKAATPTNASQLNMSSADHSNEEVARRFNWREFGAGRSDDFGSLISSGGAGRAFALADGSTHLIAVSSAAQAGNIFGGPYINFAPENVDSLYLGLGEGVTLYFTGTGLDVEFACGSPESETYQFYIDGVQIAAAQTLTHITSGRKVQKVVSGLPYGTHVFKMTRSNSLTSNMGITNFLVYQPKTPSIPTNAHALAKYNVMADFVVGTVGVQKIATGVLRKGSSREAVYSGSGWTSAFQTNGTRLSGVIFNNNNGGGTAYVEYTFFGTGFELRGQGNTGYTGQVNMFANGVALTSGNFPSATFSAYGGWTMNAAAGNFAQNTSNTDGSGARVSGLPLGKYTIRLVNTAAVAEFQNEAFDVITPIHAYQQVNENNFASESHIGNCALEDARSLLSNLNTDVSNFVGISKPRISGLTTTYTTMAPVPDQAIPVKSKGDWYLISWTAVMTQSGVGFITFGPFVNGVNLLQENGFEYTNRVNASDNTLAAYTHAVYLPEGNHLIQTGWKSNGGTATLGDARTLIVTKVGKTKPTLV